MNGPYPDGTKQEVYLRDAIEDQGFRYVEQCNWFNPYVVDFYIPELLMVIEADGPYGHSQKRDAKRDMDLMGWSQVEYVLHIKSYTKHGVEDELCQALDKYQDEEQRKNLLPNDPAK